MLAPTSTAAALLSGSTYHSVFGIRDIDDGPITATILSQIQTRLEGVEYIFLDKVSMLSYHNMYHICA